MPTRKKPTARVITGDAAVIEKLKFILGQKGRDPRIKANREWVVTQIDESFHHIKERIDLGPGARRRIDAERAKLSAQIDIDNKNREKREALLRRRAYRFEAARPAVKGGAR